MAAVWTVLVQYLICVCGPILVARADNYSKTVDLNQSELLLCPSKIESVLVLQKDDICHNDSETCMINKVDLHNLNETCKLSRECLSDFNFTTSCLRNYRPIDIEYNCKVETNGTTCDFELGTCMWTSRGHLTWERIKAIQSVPPIFDHTHNNQEKGYYMRIQPSFSGGEGSLDSGNIGNLPICLSFWYYIQGENIILFEVYQDTVRILSIDICQKNIWSLQLVDINGIAKNTKYRIVFKAAFQEFSGENNSRSILLDDITIANGSCSEEKFTHKCQEIDRPLTLKCLERHLVEDSLNITLHHQNPTFIPSDCEIYHHAIIDRIANFCRDYVRCINRPCTFLPCQFLDYTNECFVVAETKQLRINYSCTVAPFAVGTVYPSSVPSLISNFNEFCRPSSVSPTKLGTTTYSSSSVITAGTTTSLSISPTTLKTTTVEPNSVAQSSNTSSTTGIIVGVVLGIGFIVCLVALLFCFLRRSKSVRKKSASADNKILTNDYTGQQSVSLPTLSNPISNNDGYAEIQTQNVNYQHVNSRRKTSINTSGRNYAKLDPTNKLSDNKAGNGVINHDYVYIDETEAGSKQTSINVPDVNILNGEIDMNNQYSVIDPNANNDHSSELDKNVTCATPPLGTCNYLILDPNETGFFRSQGHNKTTTDYDVAIPINDKDHVSDLPDPYSVSEQGTYDSTGKVRHMEAEANLYSHSVENVYDRSSHERKTVENDSTYDHFFGDQTEDNYNITKRE